ncbi:hypothetical protein FHS43_006198 [Streptosporangium becharense]|uniref:Uncharacterized protein n=1 Tax=Streptosporangium becharense TaxID=1816182 RepID=A0A7W9MHC1_9ACTN|nr:hypothetical protein [Streptosporangium becharense]MBB2914886.1 hypothetical protein [Streptosporangium becharense]MBB5820303.1 hypothetical protein [Streptosporangium becharense]
MITLRLVLHGTVPLLMNNGRQANPLDPATGALERARAAGAEEVARTEHAAALYLDPAAGPYLPAVNLWAALRDGARRLGAEDALTGGLVITTEVNALVYDGPRDAAGLWADPAFRLSVRVGPAGAHRCRPIFRAWHTEAAGFLDPAVLGLDELERIAQTAGALVGLGDWRPRYGRFTATIEKT